MIQEKHEGQMNLGDVARLVDGTLLGDADRPVQGICSAEAPRKDAITFLRHIGPSTPFEELITAGVSAVLLDRDIPALRERGLSIVVSSDPLQAMMTLAAHFFPLPALPKGIQTPSSIDPSAVIGNDVSIFPFVTIGAEAVIGEGSVLYPNVTIYPRVTVGPRTVLHAGVVIRHGCRIGADCVVHNNTVIGADGFGYVPDPKKGIRKVPQIGAVEIGDQVEIGANSCIDRGAFGDTRVGYGSKLDNLVQIGHNVQIGRHALLCGTVKIGGSTTIGDGVVLGGGVAVADHLTIASGVRVGGHSGVTRSLTEPGDYGGFPAVPAAAWRKQVAALARLPDALKKIRAVFKSTQENS